MLSIWLRRAISIPWWLVLAGLIVFLLPVWVPVALAVDSLSGAPDFPRTRALSFFLLYLWCEVAGIAASFGVWVTGRGQDVETNAALQRWWSQVLFRGACRLFGVRVEVEGSDLVRRAPFLLFVRHSSVADTLLAAEVVANPSRILLKYVLKRELLWDPCLDIVGRRLPNAFVDRSRSRTAAEIAAVSSLAGGLSNSSAVLIYPEGTRYSAARFAKTIERLKGKRPDLAEIAGTYRHVLPPKLGGPLALLNAAPGVDVVFLDHTGFEGTSSFQDFWRGALIGKTVHVRLRRIAARDIPSADRDVWLFRQWKDTDQWIAQLHERNGELSAA